MEKVMRIDKKGRGSSLKRSQWRQRSDFSFAWKFWDTIFISSHRMWNIMQWRASSSPGDINRDCRCISLENHWHWQLRQVWCGGKWGYHLPCCLKGVTPPTTYLCPTFAAFLSSLLSNSIMVRRRDRNLLKMKNNWDMSLQHSKTRKKLKFH